MDDVKGEFARHLAGLGYEPGAPREAVLGKLRQRMGEARFRQVFGRAGGSHSASAQEEFYGHFEDIVEGNLMRSLDPGVTLDASYELYRQCAPRLAAGTRVLELGCWTGGLASFIAARHPRCAVVGVDGAQKVVDACAAHYRLPNLAFRRWNYRWGKPEDLEPADVLLCSLGVVHHMPDNSQVPDPGAIRRSREYARQRDHASGYFGLWRTAARDGALLLAVLRLRLFPRFIAWVDAAQEMGWTPRLDRLWRVELPGEGSVLPGLAFEAAPSGPLAEDAVLERWAWFNAGAHVFGRHEGGAALAAYRSLANRSVLGTREFRHNGALTRDELGTAGAIGYAFTQDALANYRLLIVSHARARYLAAGVSHEGSQTPIADDAEFGSAVSRGVPPAAPAVAPSGGAACPFFGGPSPFAGGGTEPEDKFFGRVPVRRPRQPPRTE